MATAPVIPDRKAEGAALAGAYRGPAGGRGVPAVELAGLSEAARAEALAVLEQINAVVAGNPLELFDPHPANMDGRRPQLEFLAATCKTVAAFCGNQFGKSTIGVVKAGVQVLPRELVPAHLRAFKQFEAPCHGWILCPTEDKIFDSLKPAIEKWWPKAALKGGSWGRAFNGERMMLSLACGSTVAFKTYKQDPSTLGGATLHWVLYDEPPPQGHRDEAHTRLLAHNGPEWFTMTPLKANTAWIRREIWRRREDPDVLVVKGSMHENRVLSREAVERTLASYKNDLWRRAREFGDFMDLAGQVYANLERRVVPRLDPVFVRGLDRVVGIDPGIRNAAFVFGGFDHHGVDWVFDELLIQNGTPSEYAAGIDRVLGRWGLRRSDCLFVIDPAARQRSQATGDTVQSELTRVGIFTANGNRDREAGQQQVRDRLLHDRLRIGENCVGLRDEADEFAWEIDDEDDAGAGVADDSPFHRLATLRYQVMVRPWYPVMEDRAVERNLGWRPGSALRLEDLKLPVPVPPLGMMS